MGWVAGLVLLISGIILLASGCSNSDDEEQDELSSYEPVSPLSLIFRFSYFSFFDLSKSLMKYRVNNFELLISSYSILERLKSKFEYNAPSKLYLCDIYAWLTYMMHTFPLKFLIIWFHKINISSIFHPDYK